MSGVWDPLVLATDLDGTFAGGPESARAELYRHLSERDRCFLIYVTGRHLDSARALQEVLHLPQPEIIITDVGTAVHAGEPGRPLSFPDHLLAARWPGADHVTRRVDPLRTMVHRQPVYGPRRVSYFVNDGVSLADAVGRVEAAVDDLDVDVVGSGETYIDILPGGTDKGTTLLRVLDWLRADRDWVVVAGDSLNDVGLFRTGLAGIVVGNAESELKRLARTWDHVVQAEAPGAAGILEGLRALGRLGEVPVK